MQEAISTIALSMGIAWASGINLYAAVVVLGLLGAGGYINLPETLQVLQNPVVIGASVIIYCVEFIADKVPVVDNAWDTVHTFIRIPAGAVLAASAVGDVDPSLTMAAALVGGTITAGTHLTKASSRLMVNTSPEPFSNIGVSLVEDVVVVAGVWTALFHPAIFLIFLISFILLMIWLLPILGRAVKNIFETLQKMFKPDRDKSLPEA